MSDKLQKLKTLKQEPNLAIFDELQEMQGQFNNLAQAVVQLGEDLKKKEELVLELDREEVKGEKGDKGEKGEPGQDGERGKDGKDGKQGKRGPRGQKGQEGKPGAQGLTGEQGQTGKDGSPDSPQDIKKKLIELDVREVWFDWGHIKNVPPFERRKVKRGGGGGGSVDVANDAFVGDGSTVSFTLSNQATTTNTLVFYNGEALKPTTHYSVSGTTLTLTATPLNGLAIWVWYIKE